jgi:hypothetical protein
MSKHDFAVLYQAQGRYAEAEAMFREVLKARTDNLGADNPFTLTTRNSLAELSLAQGRHAEAEPLFWEVLKTRTTKLAAGHPDILTSKHDLASLYSAQGHYAKAEPLLREVVKTRTDKVGADHPDTLTSRNALADWHRAQGQDAKAEPLFLEVLKARTARLGADHPDTLATRYGLAQLYQAQHGYEKAEPLPRRQAGYQAPAHPGQHGPARAALQGMGKRGQGRRVAEETGGSEGRKITQPSVTSRQDLSRRNSPNIKTRPVSSSRQARPHRPWHAPALGLRAEKRIAIIPQTVL